MTWLDELEAALAKATPGPWYTEPWTSGPRAGWHAITTYGDNLIADVHPTDPDEINREVGDDHLLLVELRNRAEQLIAIARATERLERLIGLGPCVEMTDAIRELRSALAGEKGGKE